MSNRMAAERRWASAHLLAVVLMAVLGALVMAPSASAHAVLTHSTPHQGSAVDNAPSAVQFDFNEPVEVSFGAVRVFDKDGQRVDRGEVSHPDDKQASVAVSLRDGLEQGIYTTTYRVVSADGHPVAGGFSFGVGEPVETGPGRGNDVAELLERSSAGPLVEGTYGVARGLHYAALLLLIGAFAFRLFVWPKHSTSTWPGRTLGAAGLVGLVTAASGILLQGALGAGVSLFDAFDSKVLSGSLSTRTGEAWLARTCAWFVIATCLLLYGRAWARLELLVLALPTAILVGSLPYAGHAETQSPQGVLIPADVVHVLAAGAWLGGLVLLLVAFWRRADSVSGASDATTRFSRLALPAIALVVTAGSVQAWFYLGSVGAFFDTTYGLALLAKIGLLVGIIALAAGNRRRLAGLSLGGASAETLRRSMRAEVLVAVLVLAATATLVRAAPPATNQGTVVRELDLGPLRLQMDIEPAEVGPNDYHLYFFNRRTGAQIDRVREVTLRLTQPEKDIGPIKLRIKRKGPAHYELLGPPLGVPGTWQAQVDVRVSRFDQYTAKTDFQVR